MVPGHHSSHIIVGVGSVCLYASGRDASGLAQGAHKITRSSLSHRVARTHRWLFLFLLPAAGACQHAKGKKKKQLGERVTHAGLSFMVLNVDCPR